MSVASRSPRLSTETLSDTGAQLSVDIHFLKLNVVTHSRFIHDAIANFFQSHRASGPFEQQYCTFNLELELTGSDAELTIERPAECVPAWFSVGDVPLMFGEGKFYALATDGSLSIEIDVLRRSLRANLGAELSLSEESFIYCFLRDVLRKFVYPFSGLLCLHGAVVARDKRVILLAGDSGAGKSTLAMQFLRQGYSIVSDDSPLFAVQDGACFVISSLDELSISASTLALFPELAPYVRGVRDISGKLYISRKMMPADRLSVAPLRLTDYAVLKREACSEPRLKKIERASLAGAILKEYMSIFSRLKIEAQPEYFAKIDQHIFNCLSLVVAGVETRLLHYADEHLDHVVSLFEVNQPVTR